MATIYDIRSDSTNLQRAMTEFLDVHRFDGPRPSQSEVDQFVFEFLDDLISEKMVWCPTSTVFHDHIEGWFTWFSWRQRDKISKYFYRDVLEPFMCDVKRKISQLIPQTDYTVWLTKRGYRDLYISRGEDYRILDWERRMASGEWQPRTVEELADIDYSVGLPEFSIIQIQPAIAADTAHSQPVDETVDEPEIPAGRKVQFVVPKGRRTSVRPKPSAGNVTSNRYSTGVQQPLK